MNLSEKQKEIVTTDEQKVVVIASAAAGKTAVLVERARYLLEKKKVDPTKIVLITFTNAAAEELADRLGHPTGMFIGTIHAFCPMAKRHQTYLKQSSLINYLVVFSAIPNVLSTLNTYFLTSRKTPTESTLSF